MKIFILCFIFVIGGIPLVIGVCTFFNSINFVNTAVSTTGKVIGLEFKSVPSSGRAHGGSGWAPRVTFIASDGREYQFVSQVASNPPNAWVGQEIDVLYEPTNPNNARINDFLSIWFWPIILFIFGIPPTGLGIFICLRFARTENGPGH